jgi:hypothetical protein
MINDLPELSLIIIKLQDAREFADGCREGWKTFVEDHGYSFIDVVRNGLTAEQLLATGDQQAIDLVYYVIARDYGVNLNG